MALLPPSLAVATTLRLKSLDEIGNYPGVPAHGVPITDPPLLLASRQVNPGLPPSFSEPRSKTGRSLLASRQVNPGQQWGFPKPNLPPLLQPLPIARSAQKFSLTAPPPSPLSLSKRRRLQEFISLSTTSWLSRPWSLRLSTVTYTSCPDATFCRAGHLRNQPLFFNFSKTPRIRHFQSQPSQPLSARDRSANDHDFQRTANDQCSPATTGGPLQEYNR